MKKIIITGATGAVGSAAAKAIAKRGNVELILMARDAAKLDGLKKSLTGKDLKVETIVADMGDSQSVSEAIKKIKRNYQRIDALVNIAAVYKAKKTFTIDKRETMFATNHLAPFSLTTGLLDLLQATPNSKVFTVTAPSSTKIDFNNLNGEKSFSALGAFGGSKMMNLLFAFTLAEKFNGTSHASIAFHPGLVKSSLLSESPAIVRGLFNLISSSPEKTGEAIAKIVLEGNSLEQNGKFFNKDLKEMKAAKHAYDEGIQKKLWDVSERMLEPVGV